jgi:cysteine desulfurase
VRENAALLGRLGRSVQTVGLEREGWVSRSGLETALARCGDPRFAALMAVNNETGAVSDIGALARLLRHREGPPIHFHSDLVQALGKIPLDIAAWDIDSAAMSAHKLGGPRGVGLLYLKRPLEPLYRGGGQEGGIRPGTENTAGALALAECLEKRAQPGTVAAAYAEAALRMKALISALKELPRCKLIPQDRQAEDPRFSPWILQAAFEGIPGEVMVRCLDDAGFAVSTGSACSSGEKRRPVLAAMGIDDTTAFEGIRISQGWSTSREDLEALTGAVKDMLWKL